MCAHRLCRIEEHRYKLKIKSTELKRLVKYKVITKVEEPTAWLSQITCVEKKNGKIRICLDPNLLNRALHREQYILPTIDAT